MIALVLGAWIGRAAIVLPDGLLELVDLGLALASAALLALWYRRRVRGILERRAARGQAAAALPHPADRADEAEDSS